MSLQKWLDSGEYLPISDFHDLKDLFKTIHEMIPDHPSTKEVNWREGMCYTVDIFLWFMANHGYTLQKCRKDLEFKDLDKSLESSRQRRKEKYDEELKRHGLLQEK